MEKHSSSVKLASRGATGSIGRSGKFVPTWFFCQLAFTSATFLSLGAHAESPSSPLSAEPTAEYSIDPFGQHVIRTKSPEWQTLPYSYTFGEDGDINAKTPPAQDSADNEDDGIICIKGYVPVPASSVITLPEQESDLNTPSIAPLDTESEALEFDPIATKEVAFTQPVPPRCGTHGTDKVLVCVDLESSNQVDVGDLTAIVDFSAQDFTQIISPNESAAIAVRSVIISHSRAAKSGFEIVVAPIADCSIDCDKKVLLSRRDQN